jgi:hypothetical protein
MKDRRGSVFAVQGALRQHVMMLRCMRQETAKSGRCLGCSSTDKKSNSAAIVRKDIA